MSDPLLDDLNIQQAKRTLRRWVDRLELTPLESQRFSAELVELQTRLDKLEQEVIHIAVFGLVGRGKSSLLNALMGSEAFATGPTHGVTRTPQTLPWTVKVPLARAHLKGLGGSRLEFIDTPGIDEVDGQERQALALKIAQQAELILFVVVGDMTRVEYDALAELREAGKPMLLVLNKVDLFPEVDRQAIYQKICNDRVKELLSPEEIVMAAASPRVAKPIYRSDGSLTVQLEKGEPDVSTLRLKILQVLQREGHALLALNALLYADKLQQDVLSFKMAHHHPQSESLIWKAAQTKAAIVACTPLTVLDCLAGAVVDIGMIVRLARLYGLPMTQRGVLPVLQTLLLGMIGMGVGEWTAGLGLGSLKSLLGLGAGLTGGFSLGGYLSVAVTQASLAAVATVRMGLVTRDYLAAGSDPGSKAAIAQILDNLDERSIISRIRQELEARLTPPTAKQPTY